MAISLLDSAKPINTTETIDMVQLLRQWRADARRRGRMPNLTYFSARYRKEVGPPALTVHFRPQNERQRKREIERLGRRLRFFLGSRLPSSTIWSGERLIGAEYIPLRKQ